MKNISFGEYKFWPGQRVAAQMGASGNWYYGVITKFVDNETAVIRFDTGAPNYKIRKVLVSVMVPVINWKMDGDPHPFEELVVTNAAPFKTFNNKIISLDVHLFDAIWTYINAVVFDGKLRTPAFKFNSSQKILGVCHNTGMDGTKPTLIEISKRNMSAYNAFETLAHEMVHQHSFEVEKVNDMHGPLFMRWAPTIAAKLGGMKLEPTADMNELNIRVDLTHEGKKSSKQKYYALAHFPIELDGDSKPLFAAVHFKAKEDALQFYSEWQKYSDRQKLLTVMFKIGVKSIFQLIYGKPFTGKYNREETTLTFYETSNPNAAKILKQKTGDNPSTRAQMQQLIEEMLYGAKHVSSFTFLTQEQIRQLGGKELAKLGFSQGIISQWVD